MRAGVRLTMTVDHSIVDVVFERMKALALSIEDEYDDNVDGSSIEQTVQDRATCVHCGRAIILTAGKWLDPEADGDDIIWRETCDSNDTFTAEHEPGATS